MSALKGASIDPDQPSVLLGHPCYVNGSVHSGLVGINPELYFHYGGRGRGEEFGIFIPVSSWGEFLMIDWPGGLGNFLASIIGSFQEEEMGIWRCIA